MLLRYCIWYICCTFWKEWKLLSFRRVGFRRKVNLFYFFLHFAVSLYMRLILSYSIFSCSMLRLEITHCFRRNSSHSSWLNPNACILHVNVLQSKQSLCWPLGVLHRWTADQQYPYPNWPKQIFCWNNWSSRIKSRLFWTSAAKWRCTEFAPELNSSPSIDSGRGDGIGCVCGIGRWLRSHWTASKNAAFQNRNACHMGWSRKYVYKYSRYGSHPGTSTENWTEDYQNAIVFWCLLGANA